MVENVKILLFLELITANPTILCHTSPSLIIYDKKQQRPIIIITIAFHK